jgi:hypothetical protein
MARRGSRTRVALVLISFLLPGLSARGAPPEEATPLSVQAIDVPINVFDVAYGYYGGWVASDGIGDRLLDLTFEGTVIRSTPLNLLVVAIYPANGEYDSAGNARVGFNAGPTIRGAILRDGYLAQGSALAVRPDDNGGTASRAFSQINLFKSDFIYSLNPVTLTSGKPSGMDSGPGGKFYLGFTTGIQIVSIDGTTSALANYSGNVNAIRGCGDWLWVGTTSSLDWVAVTNGTANVMRYPTATSIRSVDCGGNGSVVATGDLGYLYYINPKLSLSKTYQVQGATNPKVALGPGPAVRGLILDVGGLKSFSLGETYAADRDTSPVRLLAPSIRFNF